MTGSALLDSVFWFFCLVGFMFLIVDIWQYYTEKANVPTYFCVIVPAYELLPSPKLSIDNLLTRLYKNNPHGTYDIIIADEKTDINLTCELKYIASQSDNIFVATTEEIAAFLEKDFK